MTINMDARVHHNSVDIRKGVTTDLTGQRFGKLVVLKFHRYRQIAGKNRAMWFCRCDCGNLKEIMGASISGGKSKSCGCEVSNTQKKRKIDIAGQKFNRLTAIEIVDYVPNKKIYWRCLCDCGNEAVVWGASLRGGHTKSCGCLGKEKTREMGHRNRIEYGEAAFNSLYESYIKNAKTRGHSFDLTKENFRSLVKQNCSYCGEEPKSVKKASYGDFIYNGIDRRDNTKGYYLGNVVPCCEICNKAKRTLSVEEFREWINKVYGRSNLSQW